MDSLCGCHAWSVISHSSLNRKPSDPHRICRHCCLNQNERVGWSCRVHACTIATPHVVGTGRCAHALSKLTAPTHQSRSNLHKPSPEESCRVLAPTAFSPVTRTRVAIVVHLRVGLPVALVLQAAVQWCLSSGYLFGFRVVWEFQRDQYLRHWWRSYDNEHAEVLRRIRQSIPRPTLIARLREGLAGALCNAFINSPTYHRWSLLTSVGVIR